MGAERSGPLAGSRSCLGPSCLMPFRFQFTKAERELQRFDELYSKCYVARMELRLGLPATGRGFKT